MPQDSTRGRFACLSVPRCVRGDVLTRPQPFFSDWPPLLPFIPRPQLRGGLRCQGQPAQRGREGAQRKDGTGERGCPGSGGVAAVTSQLPPGRRGPGRVLCPSPAPTGFPGAGKRTRRLSGGQRKRAPRRLGGQAGLRGGWSVSKRGLSQPRGTPSPHPASPPLLLLSQDPGPFSLNLF